MANARKDYGWGRGMGAPPPRAGDAVRECVAIGECRPPHHGGKNTRLWCKGRVGVPHVWEWFDYLAVVLPGRAWHELNNRVTEMQVCFACGKHGSGRRSYCRACGEPWPASWYCGNVERSCARCGTPAHLERRRTKPQEGTHAQR